MPVGDGLADAEGIADGQHDVAHLDLVAVGHRDDRQVLGVNLDRRRCRSSGSRPTTLAVNSRPSCKRDFHLVGAVHDVVVGQDVAVLGDDDAGAKAVFNFRTDCVGRESLAKLIAEKLPPEWIIETGKLPACQCY